MLVLGRHLKYSSCLYNNPGEGLNEAERNMLGEQLLAGSVRLTKV